MDETTVDAISEASITLVIPKDFDRDEFLRTVNRQEMSSRNLTSLHPYPSNDGIEIRMDMKELKRANEELKARIEFLEFELQSKLNDPICRGKENDLERRISFLEKVMNLSVDKADRAAEIADDPESVEYASKF